MVAAAFSTLMTMETEEAQIASGLRRRDPDVLDALIEQYQHRLLRYLVHLTSERATAEDLFQETWIRVLEKGHQYDGKSRFATWLMTIAHNVAIDHLRKRRPASLDEMRDTEDAAPLSRWLIVRRRSTMFRRWRMGRAYRRRLGRFLRSFARCWCCGFRSR